MNIKQPTYDMASLELVRARLESEIGERFAAIIQSDFGVMTTRLPSHLRQPAEQLRETARKLAGMSL